MNTEASTIEPGDVKPRKNHRFRIYFIYRYLMLLLSTGRKCFQHRSEAYLGPCETSTVQCPIIDV